MNFKKRIAIISAIIGSATLAVHIANRLITFTSTLDNTLNTNKGHFYDWRFGKVFFTKQGNGSPILLIHDLESYSSGQEWCKVSKELAKKHTVYTIDLLGCGRSDKPNITYTNFLYVQLVTDFIEDIIKSETDIIASSTSSSIAIMAATFDKIKVNRIAITNPIDILSLTSSPAKRNKLMKCIIKSPIIGTFLYNILNSKHAIEEKFVNSFYGIPSNIIKTDISAYYESAHIGGLSSKYLFSSLKGNYHNANISHALNNINNSIYIIASDCSPNYLTFANQYKKQMPSIEIFSSKDTGKYPHMEKPVEFVNQINLIFE